MLHSAPETTDGERKGHGAGVATTGADIAAVEAAMRRALACDDPALDPLYGMMRYHMGWNTAEFAPDYAPTGKRLRPRLCLLACEAAGGDPARAVPVAAAIEFLHNFTLIHDDIQDDSRYRHHRRTVWSIWGMPQAINAGDGMYAVAHETLLGLVEVGVAAADVVALLRGFDAAVLRIVEGQVQDIGFETRWDITGDDYVKMIGGKTAAIFAYAARAGAVVAGTGAGRADTYAALGAAFGLGFQVRDDLLGIWGTQAQTGKPEADDIRRRKKSLPVILLHERAEAAERGYLESLYSRDEVAPEDVRRVIALLNDAGVRDDCQEAVNRYHADAVSLLDATGATGPARDTLAALIGAMAMRDA